MDPIRMTTEPLPQPDLIPFELDDDQFHYAPPKDSILAVRLMRRKPNADSDELIEQAQIVFDQVRIGLDMADRIANDRRIAADGEALDRTPPDDPDEQEEWSDPGPTQWDRICDRLEDPQDGLTLGDAVRLFNQLIAAGRKGDDPRPSG